MEYYIEDYFTGKIIDVVSSFAEAIKICNAHEGSQVRLDNDDMLYTTVVYTNIDLPF